VYRLKARRKQAGFTLIEVMVVLAIMAIMAAANIPNYMNQLNEKRASKTVVDTQTVMDAARNYRSQNGVWPGTGTCANAAAVLRATVPPMLAGVSDTNAYNAPISTSCTANTFSVDQNLIKGWDAVVVNTLPGAQLVNAGASTIRSTVGIPGTEAGLDAKLSRVNTGNPQMNRMETDLYLGGHSISEINAITATAVTATNITGTNIQATNMGAENLSATNLSATNMWATGLSATNISATGISTNAITANNMTVAQTLTANQTNITGRASFNEYIELRNAQAEGGWCPSNSVSSRNATGQTLNCINGVWAKPVTWYPGSVSGGGGCGSFPSGSMAFDAAGKLFVCK